MKKIFKIMAVVLAIGLILAVNAAPAFAATPYTAVTGGETTFTKYLAIEAGSTVPNKTFKFSIAAGDAVAATSNSMAILKGPVVVTNGEVTAPTITNAVFESGDATTPIIITDPTDPATANDRANALIAAANVGSNNLDNMDYATDTVTVDFSGCSFPEPGVYRYKITEEAQNAPYSVINGNVKYMDVYVVDAQAQALSDHMDPTDADFPAERTLVVKSYILHNGTDAPSITNTNGTAALSADDEDEKTDGFVNKYETVDLGFSKRITGNQAAKDKYFKFTVKLTETETIKVADNDVFQILVTEGAEAAPTATPATNPNYTSMQNYGAVANGTYTITGAQLKAGFPFYLNDGQFITILNLPKGITYSVTEATEDDENYKQTPNNDILAHNGSTVVQPASTDPDTGDEIPAKTYNDASTGALDSDKYVGYTNTREGVIPTGVILTVAPFMIGLLVFGAVMMFVISRRRRAAY